MATDFGRHFVALPDDERAEAIAERLQGADRHVLRYRSGRPWLIHTYPEDLVVVDGNGEGRVAVLGPSSATSAGLQAAAGDDRRIDDLVHALAGSFLTVAHDGRGLRAQGSASGMCRVYHASIDDVAVLADRADVLAELGGFELDETALAIRTLRQLPHPLADEQIWRGVHPVPPESCACVQPGTGRCELRQWWRRPDPVLSRAEGGALLREALREAVSVRTRSAGPVHCDLSGGMDSTPVCFFAAESSSEVIATTGYNDDPGGREDLRWAQLAARAMPGVRHSSHSLDEMPQFYEGLADLQARLDEPTGAYLAAPRMQVNMRRARERGVRTYLNGLGGDHLLCGLPVWEHSLFRRRPALAWQRARQHQMLRGVSAGSTLRGLVDRRSYSSWLRDLADSARSERMDGAHVGFNWDLGFNSWPRWLAPEVVDAVRERIHLISRSVRPLGENRAAHAELAMIRDGARLVRGTRQLGETEGLSFEAPFFDDRVVEACLSVRREERTSPKEFKPLIKEAMRGLLPDDFLRRTTKTGGTTQAVRGFAAHHSELLEMCARSPLAELGVIDPGLLREHVQPEPGKRPDLNLESTLNCAAFLRQQMPAQARLG